MNVPAATAAVAAFAACRRPPPPNGSGAGLSRTMAHGARDGGESDEWDDWEADEGDFFGTFQSLFDGTTFDSLEALLAHDRAAHGFDLPEAAKRLDLDFFGVIRLVNLVRKEAGDGAGATAVLEGLRKGGPLAERLGDTSLFMPVLPDDGVLCCAEQILSAAKDVEVADDALFEKREEPAADAQELQAQVERLQAQLARASALLGQLAVDEALGGEEEDSDAGEGGQDNDTYYSNGYSAFGILVTIFCVVLAAMKAVLSGSMLTGEYKLDAFDLLSRMAPLSFCWMAYCAYASGEVDDILSRWEELQGGHAWHVVWLSGLMSFSLNITSFMANKVTSPLTLTVASNVKQVLLIAVATVIFATPISWLNGIGILIVILGSARYSTVTVREKIAAQGAGK